MKHLLHAEAENIEIKKKTKLIYKLQMNEQVKLDLSLPFSQWAKGFLKILGCLQASFSTVTDVTIE